MNKSITFFIFAVVLVTFHLQIFALDFEVSGAGSSDANGIYIEYGASNGKPYYQKDASPYGACFIVWNNGGFWEIHFAGFPSNQFYYANYADTDTPPETGWELWTNGVDPVPVLSVVDYNNPPAFTSTPDTTGIVGDLYSYAVTTNDPDGNPITITAPTLPSWLSLESEVSGTPTATGVGSGFSWAHSLAYAPNGKIYVSDWYQGLIKVIDTDETTTTNFYLGPLDDPEDVDVDPDGNIYVLVGQVSCDMIKLDPSGAVLNSRDLDLSYVNQIAVAADGSVYIAEAWGHKVHKLSSDFSSVTDYGPAFNNPIGLAVASDGSVYVSEYDEYNIKKIDPDGITVTTLCSVNQPMNISLDNSGNYLYIYSHLDNEIKKLELSTNNLSTVYSCAPVASISNDLDLAPDGDIFFTGSSTDREIFKIYFDGLNYTLTGTPTSSGSYDVSLLADDGHGGTATQDYTIDVSGGGSSSGTFSIELVDAFGDGWNGGSIDVFLNGSPVLSGLTLSDGTGPEIYYFDVNCNDEITTQYYAGGWSEENEYQVKDPDGNVVAESGQGNAVPDNISYTWTDCGGGSGGNGIFTIYLADSYDDGWENAYVDVYVDGTPEISGLTVNSGESPVSQTFEVPCGSLIETYYTSGYCCETEHTYRVEDPDGTTVIDQGPYPWDDSYSYYCGTPGTVSTQAVTDILFTTATGNGNITSIGSSDISAHGVCWNTGGSPTTDDSYTDEGPASATGAFTSSMTGLSEGTTYYVRAYITDEGGTGYGDEVSFTTDFTPLFTGSGTAGDPYQIANLTDLENLSLNSNYWDKYFIQTGEVDASSTASWNNGQGFSPIGTNPYFSGSYNGQDHTITGLTIHRNNSVGMFANTNGATIENLGLVDIDFSGYGSIGGIVGNNSNNTSISKCYVTGAVLGTTSSVGGLVGYTNSNLTITNSFNMANVTGNDFVGGVVGRSYGYLTMTNCFNAGSVIRSSGSGDYQGGLLSYILYGGTITGCFWDMETSGQSTTYGDAGNGKTTAEMKTQSMYIYSGWNFSTIWAMDATTNDGYPYLGDNPPPLPTDISWTGSISTAWDNAGNWSDGFVPTSDQNVTIPDVTNDPVVAFGVGASCNNLMIESGALLTVNNGGSLITEGSVTNNGTFHLSRNYADNAWTLVSPPVSDATANIFLGQYLLEYDEATNSWPEIIEPSTLLSAGEGYALWGTAGGSYTYSGMPNNGNISKSFSYTPGGNPDHYGFNLMGNPYPSFLDWDQLNETYGAVYHFDGSAYQSWNGTGSGSSVIWPGEGFMIAPGSGGTLELNNSYRIHAEMMKSANDTDNEVVLQAGNDDYTDELYIVFNNNASPQFDLAFDAWKIFTDENNIAQVYSIKDDKKLSIDQQPQCDQIPVGFTCGENGIYTISLGGSTFEGPVFLEDTKTGTIQDLRSGSYEFAYETGEPDGRFILHFTPMGIERKEISKSVSIYSYGNVLYVKTQQVQNNMKVRVFDISGRLVAEKNEHRTNKVELNVRELTGIYLVTIINDGNATAQKIYFK